MATWLEKVQTQFVIITGDGTAFLPDYLIASVGRGKDFNVSKFEFVGVKGSLVDRREPMGRTYDMEIIFQGLNHLDTADLFDKSSENKTAWKVSHPIYGGITVQPLSLRQDNSQNNVTRFVCTVVETIGSGVTKPVVSPADKIAADSIKTNAALAQSYTIDVTPVKVSDLKSLTANINKFFNGIKALIASSVDFQTYFNAFNEVNALINNTVFDSLSLIATTQAMIMTPYTFAQSVSDRLQMLIAQLALIGASVESLTLAGDKKLYENNGGALIVAMCLSSVTNISGTDYGNRIQVLAVIEAIISQYNTYLANLDLIQSPTGAEPGGYMPNPDAIYQLDSLVSFTVINLFSVANSAKQERYYMLPEDSNIIIVAHELYGLVEDDSTIDQLIATNNIVGYELFLLQKGRQIVYYV